MSFFLHQELLLWQIDFGLLNYLLTILHQESHFNALILSFLMCKW